MHRERIVVTTDLSKNSYKVIDKAASLALKSDRWLEVLHVVEPKLFAFGFSRSDEDAQAVDAATQERLKRVSETVRKKLHRQIDRMNVQTRMGSIPATTEAFVREKRGVLLVIGDSEIEDESLTKRLLGSVARRIISRSPVNTLVVKTAGDADYKKLYIPTDFSNHSLNAAAAAIALFPEASVVLDHVVDSPSESQLVVYEMEGEFYRHFSDSAKKQAEKEMERFIARLRAQGGACASVSIQSQYALGHMDADWAAEQAAKHNADLTVLAADDSRFSNTFAMMEASSNDLFLHL